MVFVLFLLCFLLLSYLLLLLLSLLYFYLPVMRKHVQNAICLKLNHVLTKYRVASTACTVHFCHKHATEQEKLKVNNTMLY